MTSPRVYLDHNAASPIRPEARDAMLAAMDAAGNPSSIHAEGRRARALIEMARETIAKLIGVQPKNVIFTSGGTEAANAALFGACAVKNGGAAPRVHVLSTEHACLLTPASDMPGSASIPVGTDGLISLDALRARLAEGPSAVVAVQDVNSETGVRQPYGDVVSIAREFGALLICDAVQTAGRAGIAAAALEADYLFLSAHKFGGPKGVGALAIREQDQSVMPLVRGGGQERGHRAGTENVIGIAGMAAAFEAAMRDQGRFAAFARKAQEGLESGIRDIAPDAVIFGENAPRVPYTTCFAIPGMTSERMLIAFDLEGVSVSSGSACSSGKVEPSHVLKAMGVANDLAACAIRVSTGWNTTNADIERFLDVLEKICRKGRIARAA